MLKEKIERSELPVAENGVSSQKAEKSKQTLFVSEVLNEEIDIDKRSQSVTSSQEELARI